MRATLPVLPRFDGGGYGLVRVGPDRYFDAWELATTVESSAGSTVETSDTHQTTETRDVD